MCSVLVVLVLKQVLIETYWNVNREVSRVPACFTVVLIETYWNVNMDPAKFEKASFSINRNILECKSGSRCNCHY